MPNLLVSFYRTFFGYNQDKFVPLCKPLPKKHLLKKQLTQHQLTKDPLRHPTDHNHHRSISSCARTFFTSISAGIMLSSCQPMDSNELTLPASPTLHIYNWSEYMPSQIIENFEKETGIQVDYHTFESNEDMYSHVVDEGHLTEYDLIVPSTYYVDKMADEGLLDPIDTAQLSNLHQLDPIWQKIHDNNNISTYSVPYLWGTTGIGVNSRSVDAQQVTRWADLWNADFAGRVMLTKDMREVFGMALMTLGYSSNSTNPEEIKAAYHKLQSLMPNVATFESREARVPYLTEKTDVGMIWNGEVFMANNEGMETLQYRYPEEGALLWVDSFAIPKDAKHSDAAYRFINFVLRAENAQIISRELGYATPNMGARLFMPDSTKTNPTIYPTGTVIDNAQLQLDVGEEALAVYKDYWSKLQHPMLEDEK